jgi:hypothetical protein
VGRRLVSRRDIAIDVFEADSGRVEVVSRLLDPYHLIRLDLEVDPHTRTIVRSEAELANYPHTLCPAVAQRANALEGLVIGKGVLREIARRVGGGTGCVHLRELAVEAVNFTATCLIGVQDGYGLMSQRFNRLDEASRYTVAREQLAGTCTVYRGGERPGEPPPREDP